MNNYALKYNFSSNNTKCHQQILSKNKYFNKCKVY